MRNHVDTCGSISSACDLGVKSTGSASDKAFKNKRTCISCFVPLSMPGQFCVFVKSQVVVTCYKIKRQLLYRSEVGELT